MTSVETRVESVESLANKANFGVFHGLQIASMVKNQKNCGFRLEKGQNTPNKQTQTSTEIPAPVCVTKETRFHEMCPVSLS